MSFQRLEEEIKSLSKLTENTEVHHIVEGGGAIGGQRRKLGFVISHSKETQTYIANSSFSPFLQPGKTKLGVKIIRFKAKS